MARVLLIDVVMSNAAARWVHPYEGPDRRRHRVFVTRYSEYHCRDGICVAVRDRFTQAFLPQHGAIGRHITASIAFTDDGGIASAHDPKEPQVGEKLCFSSGDPEDFGDVLTSPLAEIERPPKDVVERYSR